jgi:ankyrin repeat protein
MNRKPSPGEAVGSKPKPGGPKRNRLVTILKFGLPIILLLAAVDFTLRYNRSQNKPKTGKELFYATWHAKHWTEVGDHMLKAGDHTQAVDAFERALDLSPRYQPAWNRLAEVYENRKDFEMAVKIYKKAIKAIPSAMKEWQGRIIFNLGKRHLEEKRYDEAVSAFKRSLDMYPELNRTWNALSEAFHKENNAGFNGEPWEFHFDRTDLKKVLIFIARQAGVNFLIDNDVTGTVTCRLDQMQWDKALDLFLRLNDCTHCQVGGIYRIGKTNTIDAYVKERERPGHLQTRVKAYSGMPVDLSYSGTDIHLVLQSLAKQAGLTLHIDKGFNPDVTCHFKQVPWDMAMDVILERHQLARFKIGTLIRIGKKDIILPMTQTEDGLVELIGSLLKLSPRQINVKDENGKTILFFASQQGYDKLAGYLISHGAQVNVKDRWGFTPLHVAKTRAVAEVLSRHGAYMEARTNSGFTPLRQAVYQMRMDVAEYLLDNGAASNIYLNAAVGKLARVQRMVNRNRSLVNASDTDGWTQLHHAAAAGRYEVSAFLISRGADVNFRNKKGDTPLHMAVLRNRADVVRLLMLNNARIDIKNNYGDTPLSIARETADNVITGILEKYNSHQ